MALFYNKTVFDKYGLTVPTTWAQYVADAKKLHAANPKEYITNDTGDPGFITSMIWQAGGHPYVDQRHEERHDQPVRTPGTQKFVEPVEPAGLRRPGRADHVLEHPVVHRPRPTAPSPPWSPAAGWASTWRPACRPASGDWRVAPMPQWTAGATADLGERRQLGRGARREQEPARRGRVPAVHRAPATGAQISASTGDFPASTAILNSASFLDQAPAYFGGQTINQVLSQASSAVLPGWSYLPFQVYANSIFPDTVGQAYTGKSSLSAGLQAWQQQSASLRDAAGLQRHEQVAAAAWQLDRWPARGSAGSRAGHAPRTEGNSQAMQFAIGDTDFLLDGEPFRVLSGALHYFRVHPGQWADRIRKARLMGLNTIETYVAWNAHAPTPGPFLLDGGLDLGRFLDLVAAEGMYAIVRPGPYICAEWTNGGLPAWLLSDGSTGIRRNDPSYMAAVAGTFERSRRCSCRGRSTRAGRSSWCRSRTSTGLTGRTRTTCARSPSCCAGSASPCR